MYAQIHYNWIPTGQSMGQCINIGYHGQAMTSIMCTRTSANVYGKDKEFGNVNTNYVGGAFYLRQGAYVSVTMLRETGDNATRPVSILANNDFTFFGAFMMT